MNSLSLLTDNLLSWWIQVSLIAALGAVLPMLFRIRHPKTQLAFCHFILALCVLLPFIEPWQHPLLTATDAVNNALNLPSGVSWTTYAGWIIVAGIFAKLSWLAGGLVQIRRYRASADPMFPMPESIRQARLLTHTDARFGISRKVDGPATLGYVDPIILLPESFLSLDQDAQLSIVCHELIDVKRNDWIVTLFEEVIGALFWFNPSIWLLLSQTKLRREQLVDSEVVALTAAPAPYVQALLVMAGAPRKLKSVPAAFFLTDGHLPHRVRSLLTKHRASIARLAVSYALIGCLLAVFTSGLTLWFPLIGEAQTVETAARRHLLPQTLIARTKPFSIAGKASATFNVGVQVSPAAPKDTLYYVGEVASAGVDTDLTVLPAPPPLFLQPFRVLELQGIRFDRPGDRVTPEEVARMKQALGEQTLVEVMQSEDGTVRQIKIQRRSSPDEISVGPLRFHFGPDDVNPAVPTGADSVH